MSNSGCGPLLDTIQKLELDCIPESKYFVDMKLKMSEDEILKNFENLSKDEKSDKKFMKKWVQDHFDNPGSEFLDQRSYRTRPRRYFLHHTAPVRYDPCFRLSLRPS